MLAPFFYLHRKFLDFTCWPSLNDMNQLYLSRDPSILTASGKPVFLVPQIVGKQDYEQKYESKIYLTGQIQTRTGNWHDFFNALVWKIFPRTKSLLNQLHFHVQSFESKNNLKNRSAIRDVATLFDESGVIVICSQKQLIQLLENFEWKELFWKKRKDVLSSMRFIVFGHGLYEKALNPYTGMTGKGIVFTVEQAFFSKALSDQLYLADIMLESFLSQAVLSSNDLTPVPLLGYPDWIIDNRHEKYYDNKMYFRDRRVFRGGSAE